MNIPADEASSPHSNIIIYGDSMSNQGGTGVYLKRLLDGFVHLRHESVSVVLSSGIYSPAEALASKIESYGIKKLFAENYRLPGIASECKPALIHLPAFGGKPPAGVPHVVTLHDLAFLAHPEMFPKIKSLYYKHHFRTTAMNASLVIVDSDFTGREAEKYLDIPQERIRRIYLSTPSFRSDPVLFREEYEVFDEYLLFTGTIEPRKNVSLLLDAWEVISRKRPNLKLIIAGRWGWGKHSLRGQLENTKGVIWTGSISDSMLKSCMTGAELLVYPSIYEGFGLPPLEAASVGVKSVIGVSETLGEIFGGIAEQMKENTGLALAESIETVLSEQKNSESLIEFANRFTNVTMAESVYSVYREVIDENSSGL